MPRGSGLLHITPTHLPRSPGLSIDWIMSQDDRGFPLKFHSWSSPLSLCTSVCLPVCQTVSLSKRCIAWHKRLPWIVRRLQERVGIGERVFYYLYIGGIWKKFARTRGPGFGWRREKHSGLLAKIIIIRNPKMAEDKGSFCFLLLATERKIWSLLWKFSQIPCRARENYSLPDHMISFLNQSFSLPVTLRHSL